MPELGFWMDGDKVATLMENHGKDLNDVARALAMKGDKTLALVLGMHRCTRRSLNFVANLFGCDLDDLVVDSIEDQEIKNDLEMDRRAELRERLMAL